MTALCVRLVQRGRIGTLLNFPSGAIFHQINHNNLGTVACLACLAKQCKQGRITRCDFSLPVTTASSFYSTVSPNKGRLKLKTLDDVRKNIMHLPVEQNGVKLNLGLIDIGERSAPVVLCSHGVPGGAEDFINLMPVLLEHGKRVIAPTYPGFLLSPLEARDMYKLTHSTEEKADLLKQICHTLDIQRVDMVLSHSQGSTAAYKFCAENNVRSGVFLNACGQTPQKAAQPYIGLKLAATMLRNPLFNPVLKKLLVWSYKNIGFKVTDVSHLQAAIQTVATVGFEKNLGYMKSIAEKKIPVMFAVCQNDRIVESQNPLDMLSVINVPSDNIVYFDEQQQPSHSFNTGLDADWYIRVLVFKLGGHLVHKTQEDLVVQHISQLLTSLDTIPSHLI